MKTTAITSVISFYLFSQNLVFCFVLTLPEIFGTPEFSQIHFLLWFQTWSRPKYKTVFDQISLLLITLYLSLNRLSQWAIRTIMCLRILTQFFSEILVFIHEVIDSQLKLVDLFSHGLCLTISHFNLIVTLFDLRNGHFQTINALQQRNRTVNTHPSKSTHFVSLSLCPCLFFPHSLFGEVRIQLAMVKKQTNTCL